MIKKHGFSLLELMIVLSITSILASLTYANYSNRILCARRLDGKISLSSLAQTIERLSLNEHTYKFSHEINRKLPKQSMSGWYVLSISKASNDAFTIKATPINSQKDTECESFTLDQTGHKGLAAGPWGNPTANTFKCWN